MCTLLEESLLQSILYEYRQRQSCKASSLAIYQCKNGSRGRPFYVKIWLKLTHGLQKRRFPINFAHSASAVTLTELSNEPKMNSARCP